MQANTFDLAVLGARPRVSLELAVATGTLGRSNSKIIGADAFS